MKIRFISLTVLAVAMMATAFAGPIALVQTSDAGYYNSSIGTALNGTNGGETGPFPVSNDGTYTFSTAPDLSAANSALGNWLTDPTNLNSNWQSLASIPNSWAVGTEVAVMYEFDTLGATNVSASFGVDNGIFVWLDGTYLFGARNAGSYVLGEYVVPVGNLSAGTHFLQLLLEDHGSANGYAVSITADSYTPAPSGVPEPATWTLLSMGGLAFLGAARLRTFRARRASGVRSEG